MKTLKSIIIFCFIIFFTFSCEDNETLFDKVKEGTNLEGGALRTKQVINSNVVIGNPNLKIEIVVEVQDRNNGLNTSKIQAYSNFQDNTTTNGSNPRSELFIKEFSATEFYQGDKGILFCKISLSSTELFTKLGLTTTQVLAGDRFVLRLAQVLNDGRVLTAINSNSNIVGGAYFNSPFIYNCNVVCPITENLAGTHSYVTTNMTKGGSSPSCIGSVSGTVTWGALPTAGQFTSTDYSFGMFGFCWADNPATSSSMTLTWFCKNLLPSGNDQYGDSYTYTITALSGNQLTINWSNTYGDSGTTVLTRAGGVAWPSILAP